MKKIKARTQDLSFFNSITLLEMAHLYFEIILH